MNSNAPTSAAGLLVLIRMRMELAKPPGEARIPKRALRANLNALVQLFDALKPFLKHAPDCRSVTEPPSTSYGGSWPQRCSCGLAELTDETRALLQMRPVESWAERQKRLRERG